MKTIKNKIFYLLTVAVIFVSCAELNVENLDQPDTQRVLRTTSDLETLASGLYRSWYVTSYDNVTSPVHAFSVTSDNTTCSWGNYGMRDTSSEPRSTWDNTVSYPNEHVTSNFFNDMYTNLSSARTVLIAQDNGIDYGDNTNLITAWVKFNQALILSSIALTFDQGYIVTEENTEEELLAPTLVPASEIAEKAISLFDEAIAIADANTFTLPSAYINGVTGDNELLSQLANSYVARLLAYMPRTAAENGNVDWTAVKDYALSGITSDFTILMDDVIWFNDFKWTQARPGWGRADMRIINLMDSSYPAHNTRGDDFSAPDSATVFSTAEIDDRIWTDFKHLNSNNFRPERGLYHFSSFRLSRYDEYITLWTTTLPEIYKAENDLLLAEAYLELGDVSSAAALVNAGTRITRGGLPTVTSRADVDDAIHHERQVELTVTSYGTTFFDMRKRDLLQKGTFLQLPLPAKTLEILQFDQPFYTFGGTNSFSSTGGWRN